MLAEIRERVREKAKNSPAVVIKAYQRMMEKHHPSWCDCNYCQSEAEYVNAIRLMRREMRIIENSGGLFINESSWRNYRDAELKVHNLRKARELMKKL